MLRLASVLFSFIGPTAAGICVVVALTAGYDTLVPIVASAAVGALLALPISYFVAKAIRQSPSGHM